MEMDEQTRQAIQNLRVPAGRVRHWLRKLQGYISYLREYADEQDLATRLMVEHQGYESELESIETIEWTNATEPADKLRDLEQRVGERCREFDIPLV